MEVTPEGTLALIADWPFERVHADNPNVQWWPPTVLKCGWMRALKGDGHRYFSPRVVDRGPWRVLRSGDVTVIPAIQREAGLFAGSIPFVGAADFRHARNEYVDNDGTVRLEAPGHRVVEIGDHKTTARISDYTTRSGAVMPGYAKTAEEVAAHPQMVGYGFQIGRAHV